MKPNFWLYSTNKESQSTAASLMVFGAGIFRETKIIKDLDSLERITIALDNREIQTNDEQLMEFAFSYLIDCVKILIFFENYMKAELICKGFCVHRIKKEIPDFKAIAKRQYIEPVRVKEIHDIEEFEVNEINKELFHRGLKETTIGLKELISSEKYLRNYEFDGANLKFLKEVIKYRNELHLHSSMKFSTSVKFVEELRSVDSFVTDILKSRLNIEYTC